ncbi:MAG TPA: HD domain-containing protein [Desulfomonilaceae bacterium]|nr:HD domain-containing protein [Desulfomonilaceae bacterium]
MPGITLSAQPPIPDERQCYALLEKYATPEHIIAHSRKVWDVARLLGRSLIQREHPLDLDLLAASCLLHDIGKYPCILDGSGRHDVRGEEILEQEGYSEVARIVVQHVVLRGPKDSPIREEHVLFYADKRVVHDELVSLDDRFVYLEQTYGRNVQSIERLAAMKQETVGLEKKIFLLLEFGPEDVFGLLD